MANSNLEPFEGISLKQWAGVNAKAGFRNFNRCAIKSIGVDMPKWDRLNAEWLKNEVDTIYYRYKIRCGF